MGLLIEAEIWLGGGETYYVKDTGQGKLKGTNLLGIKDIARSVGGIASWEDNVWKLKKIPDNATQQILNLIRGLPGKIEVVGPPGFQPSSPSRAGVLGNTLLPSQSSAQRPPTAQRPSSPSPPGRPLLKVLGIQDTEWGKKIIVTHSLNAIQNSEMREKLQQVGVWRKYIGYLGRTEEGASQYGITPDKPVLKQVRDVMAGYLDVSQLDKYLTSPTSAAAAPASAPASAPAAAPASAPAAAKQTPGVRTFLFEDKGTIDIEDPNLPSDERGQHRRILQRLKIMYKPGEFLSDPEKTLRTQLVNYNFEQVQREKEILGHSDAYGRERYRIVYYVAGTYDQYVLFGRLLKRYGFDTKQYRAIFDNKFKDKQTGQYPPIEGDPSEKFTEEIPQKLPNNQLQLYDAQKNGISFLYGRRRAILGDETGTGKCRSASSYVQTTYGNFKIEDIWEKFAKRVINVDENESWGYPDTDIYVHSVNDEGKIVKGKIVGFYRQKIKCKIKEITTWTNKKVEATLMHKFLTPMGWKSDLKEGEYICSSANQFSLSNNNFDNLEFAELLAWQIAEGWEDCKRATVKITQSNLSVLERLKDIYECFWFSDGHISKRNKNNAFDLAIHSKKYKLYLESLGYKWGHKSADKKIPEFIMQANNDVVRVFLRAFFDAEGHVHKRERNIELSSASKYLIYQLSLLLQRFNIMCSFDEKMGCATNGKRIKRKYYRIKIIGSGVERFMSQIGFGDENKSKDYHNIKSKLNSNRDGKPVYIILKPFFEKYHISYRLLNVPKVGYVKGTTFATNNIIKRIIDGFLNLKYGNVLQNYLKLKKSKWTNSMLAVLEQVKVEDIDSVIDSLILMLDNDLQYERVKSVKHVDYDGYVYDLCIEKYENYISDNVICHNTAQLIGAAELKMKELGDGDTLIITVNDDVAGQWEEEILKVVGENSANLISTNPLNPKKWTILHYHMFSPASSKAKENTNKAVESLRNHNFKIVIFDELHKVKHKDAAKSKHLFDVIRSIPIKWGASATISSNKPMDVKNQLRMLGHTLGFIDDRKFKADFAAIGKKGKRKSPLEKFKDQVRAAENLNKWLHLTGVYVRRKKQDIRQDMPNIKIGESPGNIDVDEFQFYLEKRIEKLKKIMPLTVLGQARLQLAISKVPLTIKRVAELVAEGKRVVVFTAFIASGMLLVEGDGSVPGLRERVKEIGAEKGHPEWDILTYTSGTPLKERMSVKPKFNKEPANANPYRVLVMSIKMGGTGVDFPNAATHMVINDYDWTPESSEQSEGRIYRINTNQPVNIEYVLAEGTLDTLLYEKVQRKRELAAIIQQWRKDYQDELEPVKASAALEQIVKAQTEIRKIDKEVDDEAMKLKKRGTYGEGLTFRGYLDYFNEEIPSVFDEEMEIESYAFCADKRQKKTPSS